MFNKLSLARSLPEAHGVAPPAAGSRRLTRRLRPRLRRPGRKYGRTVGKFVTSVARVVRSVGLPQSRSVRSPAITSPAKALRWRDACAVTIMHSGGASLSSVAASTGAWRTAGASRIAVKNGAQAALASYAKFTVWSGRLYSLRGGQVYSPPRGAAHRPNEAPERARSRLIGAVPPPPRRASLAARL